MQTRSQTNNSKSNTKTKSTASQCVIKTRSQTRLDNMNELVVNVDFDGASKAWRANKKSNDYGYFTYL